MHVHSNTAHTVNKNRITRFERSSAASEDVVGCYSSTSSSKNKRSVTNTTRVGEVENITITVQEEERGSKWGDRRNDGA